MIENFVNIKPGKFAGFFVETGLSIISSKNLS